METQITPLSQIGNSWRLEVRDASFFPQLALIPGLRITPAERVCVGLIDAISAACLVVGTKPPQPPAYKPITEERLFPFQKSGVGALLEITRRSGGALLADDVGLGKTLQALTLSQLYGGRTLVVCPAYVRHNWAADIKKFYPDATVAIRDTLSTKPKRERWEALRSTATYIITSYELAQYTVEEAFLTAYPTTLIMDEAHYLCGRQSKRTKNLRGIAALVPYKLALTATPAWNRPRDFYALLKTLFGHKFGSPSDFDFRYCAGLINEWGGMVNKGISNADELKLRLSYYMVRREKKAVLQDLPPLTRTITWIDGEKKASAEYLRLQGLNALDSPNVSRALEATHEGKLKTAVELAVQARQFLLFTYRKDHARKLQQLIEAEGVPCVCITGDLSTDQRAALTSEAATKQVGVVATIDSAGAGLNLQGVAHYGIMHAIDWLPNKMHQAEGRLHRIGQTNGVLWNYLAMRDSADEMVVRSVVNKMDAMHAVLGGEQEARNNFSDSLTTDANLEAQLMKEMYDDL